MVNKAFNLNGIEALTGNQIANYLSRELKKSVQYESCSVKEYVELLTCQGVPNWMAQSVSHHIASMEKNSSLVDLNTEDFYRELTGEEQTAFQQWTVSNCEKMLGEDRDQEQAGQRGSQRRSHFDDITGTKNPQRRQFQGTGQRKDKYESQRQGQNQEQDSSHSHLDCVLKEILSERYGSFTVVVLIL